MLPDTADAVCNYAVNLFAVGRSGTTVWVVRTSAGLVLIDAGYADQLENVLLAGLQQLGLDPAQVRYVLIGGLGMGFTLRAALDLLPADAAVFHEDAVGGAAPVAAGEEDQQPEADERGEHAGEGDRQRGPGRDLEGEREHEHGLHTPLGEQQVPMEHGRREADLRLLLGIPGRREARAIGRVERSLARRSGGRTDGRPGNRGP